MPHLATGGSFHVLRPGKEVFLQLGQVVSPDHLVLLGGHDGVDGVEGLGLEHLLCFFHTQILLVITSTGSTHTLPITLPLPDDVDIDQGHFQLLGVQLQADFRAK